MSGSRTAVRRALAGHAALGLLAGALLYLIALSGALVVMHDLWQRWEQPDVAEMRDLKPDAVQAAMRNALARDAGKPRTDHLYVRMPSEDLPRAVVTTDGGARYVDAAGQIVADEAHGWTAMVIGLHEYLHLPTTWGMMLVGALGVALAALVVTGILAHPRILRDAFTLRIRHDPQVARADWHNRLGVWTLPFVLAVTLTGSFLGLGSVGFGLLAQAYTGGDLAKAYAPVFGTEAPPDATAARLPDLAAALRTLAARVPDARPTYVIAHDPGTRGQHVQIIAAHPRRLIYGETYAFDAAGRWRGPVGMADGALGQQAAASAYNLHFGNFGGWAVEAVYVLLGLALCVVTATGTTLWLVKRRRAGLGSERLEAGWTAIVWGAPLALVLTAWLSTLAGAGAPLVTAFWSLLALSLVVAVTRPALMCAERWQAATLAGIAATGLGHASVLRPSIAPLILDGALVFLPVTAWLLTRRFRAPVAYRDLHVAPDTDLSSRILMTSGPAQ